MGDNENTTTPSANLDDAGLGDAVRSIKAIGEDETGTTDAGTTAPAAADSGAADSTES